MAYVKQNWENLPSTNTPITAERLNHIEDGIAEAWEQQSNVVNVYSDSTIDGYSCNYINEKNDYSTSEVDTGKKWIDGKSIYRKSYAGNCATSSAITLDTLTNIDKIISYTGWATSMYDWSWGIPNYTTDGYSIMARYGTLSHNLQLSFGSLFDSSGTYALTIEYTKTTD